MPKICGLVNYKPNSKIAESFIELTCNLQPDRKKKLVFSHHNNSGAFIGLSCAKESVTPYTIIYKNIKYSFVFDGKLDNARELLLSIKEELGFLPTYENEHGALATWAYILWGGFSPQRLFGKFSYAIYSEAVFQNSVYSPKLFLARDRLGIKPIYFSYKNNDTIVFSSSASSIVNFKKSEPKLDRYGLWQILFLNSYSIEGKTVFKDIYEIQPGSCAYIDCRGDGSFMVMQKRYFTVKHPKVSNGGFDIKFNKLNTCNYVESSNTDNNSYKVGALEECIEITEAPYYVNSFPAYKKFNFNPTNTRLFSCIGREAFDFNEENYIKSFFPWIKDPYENIELFRREVTQINDGFNWLHEIFLKDREIFKFDEEKRTQEQRIKMCLNYFFNLPNQLKFNEKIADYYSLDVNYPYANTKIFEYCYSNLENNRLNCSNNSNAYIKNSEFEIDLKRKLKDMFTNSEYRINYLIDKNKALKIIDTYTELKPLELIYLTHIWLEKFNVDIDL